MGFALHFGGALAGAGQEAFKQRQQQHEDELAAQAREYTALSQVLQNASPEYQQISFKHMLDYAMAKPGTGGDKQRQAATSGILQLLGGAGPETQYKNTSVGGDPRYAMNVPNQTAQPVGQMPLGGGSNLSQLLGGAPVAGAEVLNPAQTMMQNAGGRFNGPAPGAPMPVTPQGQMQMAMGIPASADMQSVVNGQGVGVSPNVQTPIPQPRTPQVMTQTGTAPVATARTPIPFLEDPIARKLREQQALNPGLIELYRGKQDAVANRTIAVNRAKITDTLAKDLVEIPEKQRASVMAYASRGVLKRVLELGGDPNNPSDVEEATHQLSAEIKQNYDEHTQKIANLKAAGDAIGKKLDIARAAQKTREDALNLQKDKAKDLAGWRAQKAHESQIKTDMEAIDKRRIDAQKDLDRIGRDPRLLNPDKYPEVARQLQDAEDNLRRIEDDYLSASQGNVGGAQAAREAGKAGTIVPKRDTLGIFKP